MLLRLSIALSSLGFPSKTVSFSESNPRISREANKISPNQPTFDFTIIMKGSGVTPSAPEIDISETLPISFRVALV